MLIYFKPNVSWIRLPCVFYVPQNIPDTELSGIENIAAFAYYIYPFHLTPNLNSQIQILETDSTDTCGYYVY